MGTGVDIPMAVTMPVTEGADTRGTMVATDGMAATTVGTAEIGGIHPTAGAGVLAGRIGVGDGDLATMFTILGIITLTLTTTLTRSIVLRAMHALPMGTTTRRQRTPVRSPGIPPQNLGELTRALLTRMTGVATTPPRCMLPFCQLRRGR